LFNILVIQGYTIFAKASYFFFCRTAAFSMVVWLLH